MLVKNNIILTNNYLSTWTKENVIFILLFISAIIAVYYAPFFINQIFFLIILFLSYNSKKDYFWIALYFVILDAPGRLFSGGDLLDLKRIAFYNFGKGITFQYSDFFMIILLIKAIRSRKKQFVFFKIDIILLIGFGIFILIYSLLFGMNTTNFVNSLRMLLPWSLFLIFPLLITTEIDFLKFNRLIFPFVFLALASQFYSYYFGNYFAYSLKEVNFDEKLLSLSSISLGEDEALRAADSSIILIYSFSFAYYYLLSKNKVFSKNYLINIISVSFLSVFLSATRGWLSAFLVMMILIFVFIQKSKKHILSSVLKLLLIILLLIILIPAFQIQITNVLSRMGTISLITKGDLSAGGTSQRFDVRGPRVLQKFIENPILGWGFSDQYYQYADRHVGQYSLLLNVGIIGFIIFNFIFLKWCLKIYKTSNNIFIINHYGKNSVKIFLFSLIGIYVIHTTSAMGWGFDISIAHIVYYCLILQYFNLIYSKQISHTTTKQW